MKLKLFQKLIFFNLFLLILTLLCILLVFTYISNNTTYSTKTIFAFSLAIGLLFNLLISIPLSISASKPILDLHRSVKKIARGEYNTRIHINSHDEIGQLAADFNTMSREIEKRINIIDFERHKLNTVLESMGEGVVALNSKSKIIAVNSRALSLMDKKMTVELKSLAEEVLNKGKRVTKEIQKDDSHLMVCAAPMDSVKSLGAGVVIILNDITELRALEEKQKIFMSNVSHELKTPLTTIQGYVELLKKGISDEIFDMSINYLESASERLTRLVNDLVELSTMKQVEFSLKPRKTDLTTLVKDVAGQMSLKAQKFGILIKCNLIDSAPVIADPVRIKQVLVNLVDNAIKYSQGDRIYIDIRENTFKQIELSVTDNGVGISSDSVKMVFEPFYRVDKARARNIGGNGLGLAISKEIIDKHGGTINIASVEGKGTKFLITLPPEDKSTLECYEESII